MRPARTILFTLLICLAFSCKTDKVGPLPFDASALIPLLVDLHLAESLVIEVPIQIRDSVQAVYIEKVLQEHQTSQARLDSLMWIIRSEPTWVLEVFTAVSDSLAIREIVKKEKEVLEPKDEDE